MDLIPWILLAVLLLEHVIFLPRLFSRAGQTSWHGYVPILNYLTWLKVIERPWYWIFLLIVPGINLMMLVIMHVELAFPLARGPWSTNGNMELCPGLRCL